MIRNSRVKNLSIPLVRNPRAPGMRDKKWPVSDDFEIRSPVILKPFQPKNGIPLPQYASDLRARLRFRGSHVLTRLVLFIRLPYVILCNL